MIIEEGAIKKRSKELIPKIIQSRIKVITLQEALKISLILV